MYRSSLIHRLFGTASDSRTDSAPSERGSDEVDKSNVEAIRDAMLLTVMPCSELHRLHATHQIQHAKSVTELWLIRADIFQYLAQDLARRPLPNKSRPSCRYLRAVWQQLQCLRRTPVKVC